MSCRASRASPRSPTRRLRRATATPRATCSSSRPRAASWPSRSSPGLPDLLAEVTLAARREQARSIGDVLLRRTRLALLAAPRARGARRRPGGARRRAWATCSRASSAGTSSGLRSSWSASRMRPAPRASSPVAEPAPAPAGAAAAAAHALPERPAAHAARVRADARAGRPPVADGHRQRLAGLLQRRRPARRPRRARRARRASCSPTGADVIDVGGESATTGPAGRGRGGDRARRAAGRARRRRARRARLGGHLQAAVARAAIAAGAGIVNDVSGLRDPALAEVCARSGAALVRHAHARRSARAPAGPRPLRRRRGRGARVPARADRPRAARRRARPSS